jgi:outer membrane immunogenic protein
MKRWLGSVALAAALSTSAMAMDMAPVFQTLPPPAAPAPYDWSGFYGGANANHAWGAAAYDAATGGATATPNAFGSAQLGYNYQAGPVVLGLETDFTRRGGVDSILLAPTGLDSLNLRNEQGWIGTVRSRAGVAADNWLFYGTGGLAYGSFRNDYTGVLVGPNRMTDAGTRTGWTAGGGVEYASGKRWSLGLEYLYADFGKASPSTSTPFSPATTALHDQSHLLRGKFNYQFDWGLPKN